MNVSRESLSVALFALFTPLAQPAGPFAVVTRTLRTFTNIDATVLPYLCLIEDDENDEQRDTFALEEYPLLYYVWLYTPVTADASVTPATILNNCLDAVDNAINTVGGSQPKGMANTLGAWGKGPALNCWIDGRVMKHVGIVGQGMPSIARIPIRVKTGV
jgi:hypothetical protein